MNLIVRKQWLHDLARFKKGVRLRAKLGALDLYCAEVIAMRRGSNRWGDRPSWASPTQEWLKYLCDAIKRGSFPPKLLRGFAQTAEFTLLRADAINPDIVLAAMEHILKQHSYTLRTLYGVFDDTKEDKAGDKETLPTVRLPENQTQATQ